jgi:hypothetical protein
MAPALEDESFRKFLETNPIRKAIIEFIAKQFEKETLSKSSHIVQNCLDIFAKKVNSGREGSEQYENRTLS